MGNARPANETREFGFCLALAICNCVGYLLSTVPPTIFDPLVSNIRFGTRNYPHAWWIGPIAVCVLVGTFKISYFLRARWLRLAGATSTLAFFIGISLPIFYPEMPNAHLVGIGTIWLSITACWILIRYFLFFTGSDDLMKVDKEARIQFIKEQLDFSRLFFLGLVGGYLGIIVGWFNALHTNMRDIVPNKGEAALCDVAFCFELCIISLFFFFGPLFELAKQRQRISALFLAIPNEPTPQAQKDIAH